MKKTILLIAFLVASYGSWAQFTFPTEAGPFLVVEGSPETITLNDAANTEGVPAGEYAEFIVTADWEDDNNSYSSEADLTLHTADESITIDPPTSGQAGSSAATTLTFEGEFTTYYDPSVDGTLSVDLNQSWSGSSANWSNVEVQLILAPDCDVAEDLLLTNVSTTSVDFSWTASPSESNGYEWAVMQEGDDPAVDTPVTDGTVGTGVVDASASGLTAQTTYDVYVRADCDTNGFSEWVGPLSATTLCEAVTAPWSEDFENGGDIPACWTQGIDNEKDWEFSDSGTGYIGDGGTLGGSTESGGYFAWLDDSSPHATGTSLVSPLIDVSGLTVPLLTFYVISDAQGNDNVDFSVDVWDGSSWNTGVYSSNEDTANGEWEEIEVDLSTLTITGDIQIRFVVDENNGTDFYDDIAIDDVSVVETPTCPKPVNTVASNLTSSSADFTWDAVANESNGYNWVIMAEGDDPETGTPVDDGTVATGITSASGSGLSPATTYDFYVQADCGGGDISEWSNTLSFTTECAAFSATLFEDFDSVTEPNLPQCWTSIVNSTSTFAEVATYDLSSPFSGVNHLRMYNSSTTGATTDLMLISPELSDLDSGDNQLRFMAKHGSSSEELIIGTITDPTDPATFTTIDTLDTMTSSYEEYIIDFSSYSGTDNYIAFQHGNTSSTRYVYLDDISWEPIPACVYPSDLVLDDVSQTTVDFSWSASADETNGYEWAVMANGEVPDTDTPIVDGTVGTGVTSATATTLTAQTEYDVYVRADCDTEGFSTWIGPLEIATLCEAVTAPWSEDFENGGDIPDCWLQGEDNEKDWEFTDTGTGYIGDGGTLGGSTTSGGYFAWLDDSAPHATGTALLTPLVDVSGLTSPWLSFYLISNAEGNDNVDFSVDVWDGSSWNTGVYTSNEDTANGEWEEIGIDLSTLTITGDIQVRFVVDENNGTDFYDDIALDDVSFEEAPACPRPSSVVVSNIEDTTADFDWTASPGESNGYEWAVMAEGEDPDVDTPVEEGTVATGVTEVSVSGLTGLTTYEFYVRTDCDTEGMSNWKGPKSFTTACPVQTIPTSIEDFANANFNYNTNADMPCWYEGEGTLGTATTVTESSVGWGEQNYNNDSSHPNAEAAYINLYSSAGSEDWLISHAIDLDSAIEPELRFDVSVIPWSGSGVPTMGDHSVQVVVSTDGGATWSDVNVVETYDDNNIPEGGISEAISLAGYSGVVKIGFYAIQDGITVDLRFYIDNFEVVEGFTCAPAGGLVVDTVTDTSADFSWDASADETDGYNWVVMADGDDPETDTPVADGSVASGTTEASATGLSADTTYDFYVQTDCGSGESTWSGPLSFTTLITCDAPTAVTLDDVTDTTANFSWDASADETNGYSWVVMADGDDPATDTPVEDGTVASGTTDVEVTGLSADTDYDFYVQTDCDSNISSWEGPLAFTTLITCDAPTAITLVDIAATTATISWDASASETGGYNWELYNEGDDPSTDTPIETGTVASGETNVDFIDLLPETGYDFYISTLCDGGLESDWEGPFNFTTEEEVCDAPTNIEVTEITNTTADVSWTASATETGGYNWAVFNSGDDPETDTPVVDGAVASGVTMVELTALTEDTMYDVYVQTICDFTESEWEGPETFETTDLGIGDRGIEGFTYYPNPVENVLHISATTTIDAVVLYNVRGQKVLETSVGQEATTIQVSQLSSGAYFMEVTANGQKGVYRVIKK